MGLVRADLRILGNLFLQRGTGRVLLSSLLSLATMAGISLLAGLAILQYPDVLVLLRGDDGDSSARTLLGLTLSPALMIGVWFGLAQSQRVLFEAPELDLWRTAPIPAWRIPLQALLRVLFLTSLWALALCGPAAALVLRERGASAAALVLLPVAVALSVAPLLAVLMAIHITLLRWFAGKVMKWLIAIVLTAASLAFSLFLLVGVFASRDHAEQVAELVNDKPPLPWSVDAAAHLLATTTGVPLEVDVLLRAGALLVGTLLALMIASFWHPRAAEAARQAHQPTFKRRGSRSWPAGVAASLRRKELAHLIQQPGQLLGMLLFAVMVFVIARERILISGILEAERMPLPVRECFALLALWFLVVLMMLYAHMGRVTLADGVQWPLYMAAPASPAQILRGKLMAIYLLLLWPVVLVAFLGATVLEVAWPVLLTFTGIALAGNMVALGVVAVVGTMPFLMRPDANGQILQSTRSIVAAFVLILCFELAALPAMFVWSELATNPDPTALATTAVAVAWLYGAAACGVGCLVGAWFFGLLLAPRGVS